MNWTHIDALLSKCTKTLGAQSVPSDLELGDYSQFLQRYNGVEGFVGEEQYLMLWTVDEIRELNEAYQVDQFAPSIRLIGTDGSDTGFGRNRFTGRYLSVPLIGLSDSASRDEGASIEQLLAKLAIAD